MTAALIWLLVGLGLIVAEVLSGEFVLVMLGAGALAGAASATVSGNPIIDVLVFAVASVGLLVLARPALKRRFLAGSGLRTNTEALIGTGAVAVTRVDHSGGQVKISGDTWSARSVAEGEVIEPGTTVTVVEISGATAVVSAL
ncbi:NfeD family protein [Saccharomonospora iraqiensis]|uniref:NfeD family protein n=1 Tax=Saccharomonospora iraqiensis TaxID=52698 RepID=UPI00022E3F77|nr:NfeD family protein [Saccharomonospora iraqiensis]